VEVGSWAHVVFGETALIPTNRLVKLGLVVGWEKAQVVPIFHVTSKSLVLVVLQMSALNFLSQNVSVVEAIGSAKIQSVVQMFVVMVLGRALVV